eukprot:Em0018g187a
MNILPKKSFHVLAKKNVDRVRKDEAAAKAHEEELQRRAQLAEQEAKLNLLRTRAREKDDGLLPVDQSPAESTSTKESGHINFFSDLEHGVGLNIPNPAHEAEKKAEQETLEKRIGLLNYLVDKDKNEEPWYLKTDLPEESTKSKRKKEVTDPLKDMQHYVAVKRKQTAMTGGAAAPLEHSYVAKRPKPDDDTSSSSRKHKHKQKVDIEELRRERRRREEAERARAEALMQRHHGVVVAPAQSVPEVVEELPGRYNSQFNPHLVRKPRTQ